MSHEGEGWRKAGGGIIVESKIQTILFPSGYEPATTYSLRAFIPLLLMFSHVRICRIFRHNIANIGGQQCSYSFQKLFGFV